MRWLFLSFIFVACSSGHQKLSALKDELDTAREKLSTAHARVLKLEEEIAIQEIAKIEKEIEKIQKQEAAFSREEQLIFFANQREILDQIIRNNLSSATEAKVVLNKILTYITEMGDGDTALE